MVHVHGTAAVVWILLSSGTTVWAWAVEHNPLMAWVIFMSGYANAATHWGAKQAAEAEVEASKGGHL